MTESSTPAVEVIHQLSGRARFRVPVLRMDQRVARYLERRLPECAGIRQVAVSPATAKVLVLFAPGRSAASIAGVIRNVMAEGTPEVLAEYPSADAQSRRPEERTVQPWHVMGVNDVLRRFNSSAGAGLSRAVVDESRSFYGSNALPGTASRSLPAIWKSQVTCLPVVLTGVAALLSVLTGGMVEGALALAIALLNAAIGTWSENRSERMLDAVRESVDLRAWLVRNGRLEEVSFDDVVPGDVLDLQPGARIPADARLVQSEYLSVDEAALTGESIPVPKYATSLSDEVPAHQPAFEHALSRHPGRGRQRPCRGCGDGRRHRAGSAAGVPGVGGSRPRPWSPAISGCSIGSSCCSGWGRRGFSRSWGSCADSACSAFCGAVWP